MFLQETHSSKVTEKIWTDEFNGDLFFSHGKTNSCGVLVGFYGNINYSVKKKLSDNSGRILVLDVTINGTEYLLINLYNGNTESEQLNILESLSKILKDFQDLSEKNIIFAGDFNLFFDQKLESAGGNPILKKLAVSKLIELRESLNLRDKWRIRNPKSKAFTFQQRHFSGILQRRLEYLFISNNMKESAKNVKILNALSTDHPPLFCSFLNLSNISRGCGLCKFNSFLISNTNFVDEMKTLIQKVIFSFESDTYLSDQIKWELLKYEILKFAINFSRKLAQIPVNYKQTWKLKLEIYSRIQLMKINLTNIKPRKMN